MWQNQDNKSVLNAFLKRTWNRLTLKLKHNTFINWLEIVLCQIVRCKMTIYPDIVPFRLVRWQDTRQTSLGVNSERGGWLVRFIKKGKAPLSFLPTCQQVHCSLGCMQCTGAQSFSFEWNAQNTMQLIIPCNAPHISQNWCSNKEMNRCKRTV